MKPRCYRSWTIAAIAMCFLWPASDAPGAAKNPCGPAFALARGGQSEAAQKAYLELFKEKPVPACAQTGLRRVIKRQFHEAGALIHAGYRTKALEKIELARAASPGARVPVELRRFVVAQRTFAKVRELDKAGFDAAAEDRLRSYLKVRPTPAGGLPADMEAIREEADISWIRWPRVWIERLYDGGWALGTALLWALLVIVGGFLLLREIFRLFRHRKRRRLSITEFSAGADGEKQLAVGFS